MHEGRCARGREPVLIDGSQGEGGGQVLRTALALAAWTGRALRVTNIRAHRREPGLRPQHLTAVHAVRDLCAAECEGDRPGSRQLCFRPTLPAPGPLGTAAAPLLYEVGTAGAVTLVAQAVLPALLGASAPAALEIRGGTHVAWSPSWEHFTEVLLPLVKACGAPVQTEIAQYGFYPRGGGRVGLRAGGPAFPGPASAGVAGELDLRRPARARIRVAVTGAVCRLPRSIAERMVHTAGGLLRAKHWRPRERVVEVPGPHPGTYVFIRGFSHGEPGAGGFIGGGFTGLGRIRKPAEEVATEAAQAALRFLESDAACDAHLADQILLPALCRGVSLRLTTPEFTPHLRTQAEVIGRFLGPRIRLGEEGEVRVEAGDLRSEGS